MPKTMKKWSYEVGMKATPGKVDMDNSMLLISHSGKCKKFEILCKQNDEGVLPWIQVKLIQAIQ